MKKTLIVAALLAAGMGAHAQWFDFSTNKNHLDIGFTLGEVAPFTEYSDFGAGVSLSAYGVYIDFVSAGPEHKYDNHVTNTLYNDSSAFVIDAGYQIPVLPWLRVMPLVGYGQTNYGITDASTVNVETNENTSSVYHDYTVTAGSRKHYFNFGAGLVVQPLRWLNIYGVYTRKAIYGGLSINLGAFANDAE